MEILLILENFEILALKGKNWTESYYPKLNNRITIMRQFNDLILEVYNYINKIFSIIVTNTN